MNLDAFFESYYRLRPVNATFTGIHEYDTALPDWSPAGIDGAVGEMRSLRSRLSQFDPATTQLDLHDVSMRDAALALSFLDVQLAELESRHFVHRNPSLAIGEAVFGIISLMTRPFAAAEIRARAAVDRLRAIPAFLAGARESITEPVPPAWRDRALRECDGADRLLLTGIGRWPFAEELTSDTVGRLESAAAIAEGAFAEFRRWLATETQRGATKAYGAGADLFDLLLARGHWTRRSRADLLAEATAALDEELARLEERARAIAPGGWPEVQERLAEAHPTTEDYLASYGDLWTACRDAAVRHDLVTWPEYPIRYVPIPAHTRDAAPFLYYLFYRSPAPYDRVAVHDYVVTPIDVDMPPAEREQRLRATNTSVIKLNHVVHHGAIGHHVQNHFAYHGASAIGRIAAVDCASRIGMFLGGTMAEGWACYATELMDEAGFLTPEESVAEQHTRARLLARAVADIRLHERSLDFEGVVSLYRDRIGMSDAAARAEACKNSMFPGSAVMYWLGTDTLRRLRGARERVEGESFSLRAFHDRLLSYGSIPTPLISDLMS